MKIFYRSSLIALACCFCMALSAAAQASTNCASKLPPGALELHYTKLVFDLCPPKTDDIAANGKGKSVLYNGVFWQKKIPDASKYKNNPDGSLSIPMGGVVTSVPLDMVPGKLPLLSGKRGFFVEFEAYLSDNDKDHWPAVWLMPIEHNSRMDDHYHGDPAGYERWLEIDVDEGGFAPGPMATAIGWEGRWPNVKKARSNPNLRNERIDRTQRHKFAVGYDPTALKLTFWHNDQIQYVVSGDAVPEVARQQNFYIIMNAASRGRKVPYTLNITRVRAFEPQ